MNNLLSQTCNEHQVELPAEGHVEHGALEPDGELSAGLEAGVEHAGGHHERPGDHHHVGAVPGDVDEQQVHQQPGGERRPVEYG